MSELNTALLKTFEKAVGLNCFVVNIDKTVFRITGTVQFCKDCYEKQMKLFGRTKCHNLMEYAMYQSVRWGGKYEFLCPAGAAFVAASGMENGVLKYGLVAGPFSMVPIDDFLADEFSGLFPGDVKDLSKSARLLPYVEPSRVSSLADMLQMVVEYSAQRGIEDTRLAEQTSARYNEIFSAFESNKRSGKEYAYPIETEKKLQSYITSGDKKRAQQALNEILGAIFFSSGADFEAIKARVTELLVLLSRAAIEGGAEPGRIFGLNRDYLAEVSRFENVEDLSNWLASMLSSFTGLVFAAPDAKHTETIQKVMEYVNNNYMNRITLNDVSEHVSFSVSYLSRMFKEEKGISLTSYINEVRIRAAKMLIKQSDISLSQAAYLCGFDDQSYFSKVFKKMVGITPGKYREQK